jgi:hypothetical protein
MTNDDRSRADARFKKVNHVKAGKNDQDVAAKAVLDNMARLKALRLAREATEPARTAAPVRKTASKKKATEKGPALSEWLAGQQNGGRRT